jgi:hypothetical protein
MPLLFPPPAHAYLDPGTGSYIFQILIASVLGGTVALRSYWGKIKEWVIKKVKSKKR